MSRVTSPLPRRAAQSPVVALEGEQPGAGALGGDRRVSAANAAVLYRGLKDQGVSVELTVYPGVGHVADRPAVQRAMADESLAWFGRWIWGQDGARSP